jgi:hypothetical protein
MEFMNETTVALDPATVNVEFEQLMARNFSETTVDALGTAMLEQQLTFGALSLDDEHTKVTLQTEKGQNALFAHNFVAPTMIETVPIAQRAFDDMQRAKALQEDKPKAAKKKEAKKPNRFVTVSFLDALLAAA